MAVTLVAATAILADRSKARFKKAVGWPPPDMFPIVVLTPETDGVEPHIVYYKDLEAFRKTHPKMTFLIPSGSETALNQRLDQKSRYRRDDFDSASPDPWSAEFKVRRISPTQQFLEVSATWDDDRENIGWYEAEGQAIHPRQHQFFFGPGVVMGSCLSASAITAAVGVLLTAVAVVWTRRRRPTTIS